LEAEIAKAKKHFGLAETTLVHSCYEAGRDGFWLHRYLTQQGVNNLVVDSASIDVKRRLRRAKSDRLDAGKLLTMLIRYTNGEDAVWSVVRVPSVADEDGRQLHRDLLQLKGEQTEHVNRIKGLLASCGLAVEVDQQFPELLGQWRLWDGQAVPAGMQARLLREWQRWQLVHQQIADLEKMRAGQIRAGKEAGVDQVRELLKVRGIGTNSAWLYVKEFFAWRQIRNRRQLAALAGLTPTPYTSGASEREQGISKAGNRRLRTMAIEIAWGWLSYQPQSELSRWYQRRYGGGNARSRRIGIVALARKLLVRLWLYVTTGEVPAGAELVSWQAKLSHHRRALAAEESACE
jgi:transposase